MLTCSLKVIREYSSDLEAVGETKWMTHLKRTSNVRECRNPTCDSKAEADIPQQDNHYSDEEDDPASDASADDDPNICDCAHAKRRRKHDKILQHIQKIEYLNRKLEVSFGVAQSLRKRAEDKPTPTVDTRKTISGDSDREELDSINEFVEELFQPDEKYGYEYGHALLQSTADIPSRLQMGPGRLLCDVPEEDFHCHHCKIFAYAPMHCNCSPTACVCARCIITHVKHAVADYEDAVARISRAITRMRSKDVTPVSGAAPS